MTGAIFIEALRRNWRAGLFWGLGIGLLGYVITVIIGDAEFLESMTAMLDSMPPAFLQAFGATDVEIFSSTESFIGAFYFSYVGLILGIYGLLSGINISANEEEAGILDIVLSLPVGRLQLLIERFAAYSLISLGVVLLAYVGLLLGLVQVAPNANMGLLLVATLNMLPMTLFMMAFTASVAVLVRRRSTALGIATAYLILSYFLDFIAGAVTHVLTRAASAVSMFTYLDNQSVLQQGLLIANVLVLLIAGAVFAGAALYFFKRRDIGV